MTKNSSIIPLQIKQKKRYSMPTSLTCKELKVLYNESQSLCATLERHLEEHITGTELEIIKINYNRLRITMVALVSSFTSPPYPAKQPVLQILNNIFLPELQKDYIIEFRDQFCIVQNATNGSNSYYKENNYFFDPTTSKKSRAFMKIEQNDLNGYWEVVFFVGSKGVKGIKRGFFNPENDEFIENFSSIKRYGVDLQRADSSGFWRVGTEEKAFLFNPRTKEIVDSFDSVEYHDTNGFWDVI